MQAYGSFVLKFQTAMLNIIINAIEAMDEKKGHLKISVIANNRFCEIIVEDNGKGLEPYQIAHIFEPFYTTKSTGTGLGLPSAKTIIDSHGGMINVESLPGKGTRFVVTLAYTIASSDATYPAEIQD